MPCPDIHDAGGAEVGFGATERVTKVDHRKFLQKSDAYRLGYEEARDLMTFDLRLDYTFEQGKDYLQGYNQGLMERVDEGAISIKRARELMRFPEPAVPLVDHVNHPPHYTDGKIEVSDFIADKKLDFFLGNVVKYVARAGKKAKDKVIEDLSKARWYLNYKIVELGGEDWNPEKTFPKDLRSAVVKERKRQIDEYGYTQEHDDHHGPVNLLDLAEAYFQHREVVKGSALMQAAKESIRRKFPNS